MTEIEKLMEKFEKAFSEMKEKTNLSISLEDLDRCFAIKDSVKKEGFISERVPRQIIYVIVDYLVGWNNYLHSLIMPNPQNMMNMGESKVFTPEEKKEMTEMIKKIMGFVSRSNICGLTKDEMKEKELIEDAYNFYRNEFKEKMIQIMNKINQEWIKQQ